MHASARLVLREALVTHADLLGEVLLLPTTPVFCRAHVVCDDALEVGTHHRVPLSVHIPRSSCQVLGSLLIVIHILLLLWTNPRLL